MTEDTQEGDIIATFLNENVDLIVESETEKKQRIAGIETRLIEHLRNDRLRRFLLKYKELTGKDANIVLTPSNKEDAHVLVLNQDGLFLTNLSNPGMAVNFYICQVKEDQEPVSGWVSVKVLPTSADPNPRTDGKISTVEKENLVNSEFLTNLRGGGTLVDVLDTKFKNPKYTPSFFWDTELKQFKEPTNNTIDLALKSRLDTFALEMRDNIRGSPTLPLTNPIS